MKSRTRLRIRVAEIAVLAVMVMGVGAIAIPALARTTCTVSSQWGACQPGNGLAGFTSYNNVWNPGVDSDWSQTMTATKNTQWTVNATMDGTGVVSYPESAITYAVPKPIAEYNTFAGQWHSGLPSGTPGDKYEFAYDMWLDGLPGLTGAKEVMIWTQNYGQSPGGMDMGTWTDPTFGNQYEVWANSGTVWFVCKAGSHTGSVDIKAALNAAIADNWPGDPGIVEQSSYGAEIVSTHQVTETFYLYGVNFITS